MVEVYLYECVVCGSSETSSALDYVRDCRSCNSSAFVHDEVYLESDLRQWAVDAPSAPSEAWEAAEIRLVELSGRMKQAALRPDPHSWRNHAAAHFRLLAWLYPFSEHRELSRPQAIEKFVEAQVQWWETITFEPAVAELYRSYRRLAGITPDEPSPGSIGHASAVLAAAGSFIEAALARWDHLRTPLTIPSVAVYRQTRVAVLGWLLDDSNEWLTRDQRKMLAANHVTLDPSIEVRAYELAREAPQAVAEVQYTTCPSCGAPEAMELAGGLFCPACTVEIARWITPVQPFMGREDPDVFSLDDDGAGNPLDRFPGIGDAGEESVSLVMEFDADPSYDDLAGATESVVIEIEDYASADENSEGSIIPGETDRYSAADISSELSGSFEIVHDGPSGEATILEEEDTLGLESFDSPEEVFEEKREEGDRRGAPGKRRSHAERGNEEGEEGEEGEG